jgi:LuxR family transcriptional regulator
MLTLLRGTEPVADAALASQLAPLRWLAQVAQLHLAPAMRASLRQNSGVRLTAREVEVLRWTADGKSTRDVADILQVSTNTVGFHIKNAMAKLQSCNKTASVVQAALLGYLY